MLSQNSANVKGGCAMKYERPEVEIVRFETEDVIRTSSFGNNGETTPDIGWQ